jgi:negative regulator of flagellin synthesis FlgM
MANDITNINSNRSQLTSTPSNSVKIRDGAKSHSDSDNSAATGDRVTLTNAAARIQDIEHKLSNSSSIDSEHVAAVQKSISNGEYTVNPDRIADKMIAFEDYMSK